jgi:cytochrome c oxidase subunit II
MMGRASRRKFIRLAAVAGGGFGLLGPLGPFSARAQGGDGRVIEIEARRFVFTPSEIHIRQGELVTLAFKAQDFIHGFSVPELAVRADLIPGLLTKVKIQVEKAGRFDFLCDNFCGDGHEEMHGVLIVE